MNTQDDITPPKPGEQQAQRPTKRLLRVAVIDDNLPDLLLARTVFDSVEEKVMVETYESGASALQALRQPDMDLPDVILLDINMPIMTGFEVLQILKADLGLKTIPVVMLATSELQKDVDQAYSLYASSYMVKSIDFSNFLEQVESFIRFWNASRLSGRSYVRRSPPTM
ncbi:response regulator [Deinococcus oregonensis]|uniref:Response regulator n=1 Tax=Deinococcus oregonensis TaxID=1805970 RepID=A0ABV6B6X0_9DEIO